MDRPTPDAHEASNVALRPAPCAALNVAPLAPVQVHAYRALMLHAYAAAADAFTSTAEERAGEPEAWWLRRMVDPAGLSQAFGAFLGDELVGTVTVEFSAKPKTRHKAHLIGMFVREDARGQGAGLALVQAALKAAAARPGVRLVTLTVTEGNAAAIHLYERCGFVAFGTEPMAIATPSGFKAKVHMAAVLPAALEARDPGAADLDAAGHVVAGHQAAGHQAAIHQVAGQQADVP